MEHDHLPPISFERSLFVILSIVYRGGDYLTTTYLPGDTRVINATYMVADKGSLAIAV